MTPRFAFEQAIMTAAIVVHLLPDLAANAGTLHAERELLSQFSTAGHDRLYVDPRAGA